MNITLLNTPNGEVLCTSINDAEIESSMCIEHVRVKIANDGDTIFFDFNPNKIGFTEALTKTRNEIEKRKSEIELRS